MTLPQGVVTVTRLRELTVRADTGLRVQAPKQAIIAGWHGMVALGVDEQPLPAKRGAQIRMAGIKPQALWLGNHAAPPFALCTSGTS